MGREELAFDHGVIEPFPVCEFNGWQVAAETGGVALHPWRDGFLAARARNFEIVSDPRALDGQLFRQALVHLQKSRAATSVDLAHAWRVLEPEGRLLLSGGNPLGITSAVKRLSQQLEQRAQVLTNRRHARIVEFRKRPGVGPVVPRSDPVSWTLPDGSPSTLFAEAGVFSASKLDAGTELIVGALCEQNEPANVLDLGCGIGPLGLAALLRWPKVSALLLDADARAVRSAQRNVDALHLGNRCRVGWWDANEPCPEKDFDLILMNPPFHRQKAVDLTPAQRMFQRISESLSPNGRALIVANRSLPYERSLSSLGKIERLCTTRSYKLISFSRQDKLSRKIKAGRREHSH